MKFKVGNWVIVTRRRLDGPDLEAKGKIIEATPDFAVARCFLEGRPMFFTMSEDTQGLVSFRRMTRSDWRRP